MDTHPRSRGPERERSLGELFKELATESSALVRQELDLARSELRQNVRELRKDAAGLMIGVGMAVVGGLVLVAFLVTLLGDLLGDQYWLGALIVAVVLVGGGALLALRGARNLRSVSLAPEQTLTTLRTTQSWASEEAADLRAALAGRADGNGTAQANARTDGRGGRAAASGPRPSNRIEGVASRPEPRPTTRAEKDERDETRSKGKKGLVKAVIREVQEDDITGQAAKVAYYAFLSMPPALMAVFGLAGLFGSLDLAQTIQQEAQMVLPASVTETIVTPFIEEVVLNKAPGPLSIGLLLALWGASAVFIGLMTTLNVAYDVEETRGFVKQRAIALGVMAAGALLFLLAAGALLAGPAIAGAVGLGSTGELIWTILQWPLAYGFMVIAFWIGYYFLPNRDQSACKKVLLKASAMAALLWVAATAAFRVYIANFSSYSDTYGFLGAFIVLLLWLYVTGLVVLAGGELASEMERR